MADTKISDLPAVTDVIATDEYVLARSGATNKIDASDLLVADNVAFTPAGTISATDVQAAIEEVAIEAGSSTSELDYAQFTSPVSITATTEATATTIVTGNSVAYDGSTIVVIEFFVGNITGDAAVVLYDGSSSIGLLAFESANAPMHVARRLTPSNASHTYSIRGYKTSGSPTATGGAGGVGNFVPGFIRIFRV